MQSLRPLPRCPRLPPLALPSQGGARRAPQSAALADQISLRFEERLRSFREQRSTLPQQRAALEALERELGAVRERIAGQRARLVRALQEFKVQKPLVGRSHRAELEKVRASHAVDSGLFTQEFELKEQVAAQQALVSRLETGRDEEEFVVNYAALAMEPSRTPLPTPEPPPLRHCVAEPPPLLHGREDAHSDCGSEEADDWPGGDGFEEEEDEDAEEEDNWEDDNSGGLDVVALDELYSTDSPEASALPSGERAAKRQRRVVTVNDFVDQRATQQGRAAQQVLNMLGSGVRSTSANGAAACSCRQSGCTECSGRASRERVSLVGQSFRDLWCLMTPADRERTSFVHQYTYKRRNHFKDWLSQFQAKENSEIPTEVLDKVRLVLQERRRCKLDKIAPKQILRILKDLKLRKMYEHKNLICNKISGNPPPFLSQEEERTLHTMFEALQEPFERHKPRGRKNFLSYSYTLNKLLRIMGFPPEIWEEFKLLEGRPKLAMHDETWRKMMRDLDERRELGLRWPFHPSV